jgi:hypothetical protein
MLRTGFFVSICVLLLSCPTGWCMSQQAPSLRLGDNAVPGWREDSAAYMTFDTAKLYLLIDGGASLYINHGLINGIHQLFHFDTLYDLIIYAEDFGTPANTRATLTAAKAKYAADQTVPGYPDTTAIASVNLGGCTVYSRFKNFYVELLFSGYSDFQKALQDAGFFLAVYKTMITPGSVIPRTGSSISPETKNRPAGGFYDIRGRRIPALRANKNEKEYVKVLINADK